MNSEEISVFIVDDDSMSRLLITRAIENTPGILFREFHDGEACLAALEQIPDIIILDIEMPGLNGISVCRHIRDMNITDTQVIFVSIHDDLETRLAAYDAGGSDYLIKPYSLDELKRKINVSINVIEAKRKASERIKQAEQVAFNAISSMGEIGVLLDFLRSAFVCQTAEELCITACNALKQFSLSGLIQIRDHATKHSFSTAGDCTALEESILVHVIDRGRIFQFQNRLVINYPLSTLMIHNLPAEDIDLAGRLRDHLAILAEGTEARYLAIRSEANRNAQATALLEIAGELGKTLIEIEQHQESHRVQALEIVNEQLNALTRAFVQLGLTERQEETLVRLTQEGIDRTANLQDYGIEMSRRLHDVSLRLRSLAAPQT